jgi:hypothetical protein
MFINILGHFGAERRHTDRISDPVPQAALRLYRWPSSLRLRKQTFEKALSSGGTIPSLENQPRREPTTRKPKTSRSAGFQVDLQQ